MELLQILYLHATADRDISGACVDAQSAAFACFTLTGNPALAPGYTAALASVYSITIAPPGAASDICTPLVASPLYPDPTNTPTSANHITYSLESKICFFRSERSYWNALRAAGSCDPGQNPGIAVDPNHAAYKTTLDDCLIRGTVLPL
jgi:hypothetical protein